MYASPIAAVLGVLVVLGWLWLGTALVQAPTMPPPPPLEHVTVCDRRGVPTTRVMCRPEDATLVVLLALEREGRMLLMREPYRRRHA